MTGDDLALTSDGVKYTPVAVGGLVGWSLAFLFSTVAVGEHGNGNQILP